MTYAPTTNKSRLVIVDPQLDDYRCLVEPARKQSVRLTLTSTGGNALRLAPSFGDAVWLVNFTLPDMGGVELIEMLHSLNSKLRAVAVDSSYDPQRERQALESQVVQYVCKPIQLSWVLEWLEKHTPTSVPNLKAVDAQQPSRFPSGQTR